MNVIEPEDESKSRFDLAVNTSELDPQVLKQLVDNNPDLANQKLDIIEQESEEVKDEIKEETNNETKDEVKDEIKNELEEVSANIENDPIANLPLEKKSEKTNSKVSLTLITEPKLKVNINLIKMINELEEKDKIIDILKTSNYELQSKIESAQTEYSNIMQRLKEKSLEDTETTLNLKIKETEKETFVTQAEVENYKKSIDNLKNKIEFKMNLEKSMNLENVLKQEMIKNKDIKRELDSLNKVNNNQAKALSNYDKENRITEKIDILKSEIKITRESLKEYQEKHAKQEKYIKNLHEKLSTLENNTKKLMVPRREIKKTFTKEDLRTILEFLNKSRLQIIENRKILKNTKKQNDDKLNNYANLNKKIEADFKENDKMNKMLIFKKNELKRLIKLNSNENKVEKIDNKNTRKIIQHNGDISHLFPNRKTERLNSESKYESQVELPIIQNGTVSINYEHDLPNNKLFSKNPNKKSLDFDMNYEDNQQDDLGEFSEENMDLANDSNLVVENNEGGNFADINVENEDNA